MKNILCFGDSNTWGYNPKDSTRYPVSIRWTGVLQKLLGEDYRVIEAGMNARTTTFDDPWRPYLKGRDALPIELTTHKPLDLLIISLGTNDLKQTGAFGSARGAQELVDFTKELQAAPSSSKIFPNGLKILLISPIKVGKKASDDMFSTFHDKHEESLQFPVYFAHAAKAKGIEFLDAQQYAEPSDVDGIHMMPEDHERLAKAIAAKVQEMLD